MSDTISAEALGAAGDAFYNVTVVSLRQSLTPDRLLGRVGASTRFVVWGAQPFGARNPSGRSWRGRWVSPWDCARRWQLLSPAGFWPISHSSPHPFVGCAPLRAIRMDKWTWNRKQWLT